MLDDVDDVLDEEPSELELALAPEPEDESLDDVALDDSEVELDVDVELVDDLEEPPRESFL